MESEFRRESNLEPHGVRREPGAGGAVGPARSANSAVLEGWRAGVPGVRMTAKEAASLAPARMTAKEAAGVALQRRAAFSSGRDGARQDRGEPGQRAGAGVPAPTAGRAMPEAVRERMESAFSADFSDLRIHPGSARATALGALAYTQGSDIHVAPGHWAPETGRGQELLGHEIAHVVQQREGRVRATAQTQGVALNDEPALEREADELAQKAVKASTEPAQRRTTAGGCWDVMQRTEAWGHDPPDAQLTAFVKALDTLVNQAARMILQDPLSIPETDGYIARWKAVMTSFMDEFQGTGDLKKALEREKFIYAAYGYAVESLTNVQIGVLNPHLPAGAVVSVQATRGHTRPDVVVRRGDGTDVGWFDITASNSKNHINGKTGSGWKNQPYVAEVTYRSLDDAALMTLVQNALTTRMSSGELERLRKMARENRQRQERHLRSVGRSVKKAIEAVQHFTNMTVRANEFESVLATELGIDGKLPPQTAKGVLAEVSEQLRENYGTLAGRAGYRRTRALGRNSEAARDLIYGVQGSPTPATQ
ncbi:DUF4157 domain-containing protein [Sorangium sp. So ce281]|uniref:eCIS core domain-containing protein n=1 Tax=unclassified Sorangium TaxID=2621164 RepID=UPI003F624BE7